VYIGCKCILKELSQLLFKKILDKFFKPDKYQA